MQKLDRKPRILVLTSTFPRWNNDTEPRFVLDLCRYLLNYADIRVLAPHTPGALGEEMIENVHVQRFRYFITSWQAVTYGGGITANLRNNPWRLLQLPFFFVALWWQTLRLIRTWEPDIIHAHWIIPQGLVACIAAPSRLPVLCTSHGGDLHGLHSYFFQRLKSWVLNRCQAITVVSQSMIPPIKSLAPKIPAEIIPMGTDLTGLFTQPSNPDARKNNEILFVGRLVEKKGLCYLIEAFAKLKETQPDLKLIIAGDGPLREELQLQVDRLRLLKDVSFFGSIQHKDLPALYQKATIAVFPFVVAKDGDQEGFGLVIIEAMGCGCPVIASDLPAVRQSIEPGVTGILTPPGEPVALADAIHQCLTDSLMRTRMATSALALAQERFDWPSIAEQYIRVIENTLQR